MLLLLSSILSLAICSDSLYAERGTSGHSLSPLYAPGTFTTDTITIDEDDRTYGVWVPHGYDEKTGSGLILSYHGAGGDIEKQRALDGFTDSFFNSKYIVVYLQGAPNDDDDTTWEGSPGALADDLSFTSALLDRLETELSVDSTRVFATGKSQGAGFVGRLACDSKLSKRIAAFAPVSGAYYNASITRSTLCHPQTMPIACNPGRGKMPIMAYHGGADHIISYFGGFHKKACLPDIKYWTEQWAVRNGLSTVPHNTSITETKPGQGGTVMSYGDGLVRLVFDGWNVPHDWPANRTNEDNGGRNLVSFNATSWIMDFFNEHTLAEG